ncbi:MAG: alanine racemase [Candidatus Omnitrophica bacterium]|nr:alanine racemase [Candidatus Omnitrophota bacterium]
MNSNALSWAEIDLKAVRHNYQQLKKFADRRSCEILTVIKADAYGHGMLQIAQELNDLGVQIFGVSNVEEGMALRKAGIRQKILLFESTLPFLAKSIVDYQLTPTICTLPLASAINDYAKKKKQKVAIHVKIDTGMTRLGLSGHQVEEFLHQLSQFNNLSLEGIYTHLPMADSHREFTHRQIQQFEKLVSKLQSQGYHFRYIHAANSMGLVGYETRLLNLARSGLMLYGLYPHASLVKKIVLKPAMSVKSQIIYFKDIPRGQGISYGHSFKAHRPMTVATLPIGYQEGYFRVLSNQAHVLIQGKRCPVIGRVTMDQIIVDVSEVKNPKLGMPAVILGQQGRENISVDELARHAQTISYEIVCSLGSRLTRICKG